MKRWILLAAMAILVAVPVIVWANTVVPSLSLSAYLYSAGRLLALVAFVFIFFQFVFSSKIKWIERGVGLDKLFAIHRTSGLIGLILILIHPALLTLSDLVQGYMPSFPPFKLVGFTTLTILVVAAGAALLYARLRLRYETWKAIHWANYVVLPLGILHSLAGGSDLTRWPLRALWFVLGGLYVTILLYKIWNRVQVRRHPLRVVDVVQETHDIWSLFFQGDLPAYKPGQFLIVRLIREGRVSEPHPFTISSSPASDRLSISVKSLGDFTSTIADTKDTDSAYIDMPYGVFSFLHHDADNLVFVAGGIGCTPFMSMLRYMRDKGLKRNVLLIWGNRTEQDIPFRDELEQMTAEMPSWRIVHVMSRQADWPGEKGYVNADLLRTYLSDVERPQVFLCGPPVMMNKVIPSLHELGIPKRRIHYERFALR